MLFNYLSLNKKTVLSGGCFHAANNGNHALHRKTDTLLHVVVGLPDSNEASNNSIYCVFVFKAFVLC